MKTEESIELLAKFFTKTRIDGDCHLDKLDILDDNWNEVYKANRIELSFQEAELLANKEVIKEIFEVYHQEKIKNSQKKTAEEILAKCACIDLKELEFKNEVQTIRPSEALEVMQEHAKNYHAEQLRIKIEPTDEDIRNEAIRVKSQIGLFPFDQASFQMGAEYERDGKIPIN